MTTGGEDQLRRNAVLERLLARAGWTPENLGDRLNELAAVHGLGLHGHRRTPRRWVYAEPGRPAPRVPRDPWPALVCHVLHERLGERVTLEERAAHVSGDRARRRRPSAGWTHPAKSATVSPSSTPRLLVA